MLFAFARDGFLPSALGRVSPRTGVPVSAILVHAAIAAALAITGTFETLIVLSVLSACGSMQLVAERPGFCADTALAQADTPLDPPALPFLAALGCGTIVAAILLARWDEIGGFVAAVLVSGLLYWIVRRVR